MRRSGHGRGRRLPERRQVDARQPADRLAPGRRARDARRHARPQGARLRVDRPALPAHRHRRRRHRRPVADDAHDRRAGARRDRRGRPRPLRPRHAGRDHAGRRGARGDPARSSRKPMFLLANKIDDPDAGRAAFEFHRLGLGDPIPLSADARPRHRRPARRDRRRLPGSGPAEAARRRSASRSSGGRTSASRAC